MTGRAPLGNHRTGTLGLLAGLGVTSASLSSGFVWAYEGRALLVVLAATGAWGGYLLAHYAATGSFVDDGDGEVDGDPPEGVARYAGVALGVAVLVAGMYVGTGTIRAGDHLATNVGGVLFLGGYVVAHYAATGDPL